MTSGRLGVCLIISAITFWRLWAASAIGLGDAEAYYFTWSRSLAFGYYDHGPVVALLIRLGTTVFGESTLGVRAPFILLSAATLWILARSIAQISDWRTGFAAMLVLLCMPMFAIAGGAANPDVPTVFFTVALVAVLYGRPTSRNMLLGGLLCGLAISSKLFALALVPGLFAHAWRSTQRPRLLLAAAVGVLLTAWPHFYWNGTHDWASFAYHLSHRHTQPVGLSLTNVGKLLGGQLAYVGPITLAGFALLLWRRVADLWREERARLLLAMMPLAAGYGLILIVPGAEPHWPAIGYLPLAGALAMLLLHRWDKSRAVRLSSWLAVGLTALIFVAFHLHLLTPLGLRLLPSSYNPRFDLANELWGWDEVARVIKVEAKGLERPGRPLLMAGAHYTVCGQLVFALRDSNIKTVCPSARTDQFDFAPTGDGQQRRGVDLLYLWDYRLPYPMEILYRCGTTKSIRNINLSRGGRPVRRFRLSLCRSFQGLASTRWPPLLPGEKVR